MMDRSQGTRSAWTGDARKVQVTRSQELGVHGGQETGSDGTGSASERDAGTRGPECAAGAAGAGAAWAGDSGQASTHRSWCRSPGRCLPCRRHCRHCRCRPPDRPGDGAPRPACRPAPEVYSPAGAAPPPTRNVNTRAGRQSWGDATRAEAAGRPRQTGDPRSDASRSARRGPDGTPPRHPGLTPLSGSQTGRWPREMRQRGSRER